MRQFVDFRSRLDAANDVDGTGVDRALVNTQTASAETRTGRDPTMGLCAAVAAVQSTEAHHYPLPQPAGNRVSKTCVVQRSQDFLVGPGSRMLPGCEWKTNLKHGNKNKTLESSARGLRALGPWWCADW